MVVVWDLSERGKGKGGERRRGGLALYSVVIPTPYCENEVEREE